MSLSARAVFRGRESVGLLPTPMTTVLVVARIWLIRVTWAIARLLPIKRRVVLAASNRARIDGNLAAIRCELLTAAPRR